MIKCHYRNRLYICLALICMFFGLVMPPCVIYGILSEATGIGDYLLAGIFLCLGMCFIGMGVLFALYIKNWSLEITSEDITYTNILGKRFQYTKTEILGYSIIWSSSSHNLGIRTEKKIIWLNSWCSNYYKAKEWMESNYSEWNGKNENI